MAIPLYTVLPYCVICYMLKALLDIGHVVLQNMHYRYCYNHHDDVNPALEERAG